MTDRSITSALSCCLRRIAHGRYVVTSLCGDDRHEPAQRVARPHGEKPSGLTGDVRALQVRVRAFVDDHPTTVISHLSAACAHVLPFSTVPHTVVEVHRPTSPKRTSTLIARSRYLDPRDIVRLPTIAATSLVRTLLDIAADYPAHLSVPMIDSALSAGRVSTSELEAGLERMKLPRRRRRIARAIALSSAARESVAESVAAVRLDEFGITDLVEQHVIVDPATGEFVARVDFWHAATRTVVEIDGAAKYSLSNADPRTSFEDERKREYRIRNLGIAVYRVRWQDLWVPGVLERIAAHIRG